MSDRSGITQQQEDAVVARSRDEFIRMARESEVRFFGAEADGRLTVAIYVGPWRCECGHTERSAGALWDHSLVCSASKPPRERGQLSLFNAGG